MTDTKQMADKVANNAIEGIKNELQAKGLVGSDEVFAKTITLAVLQGMMLGLMAAMKSKESLPVDSKNIIPITEIVLRNLAAGLKEAFDAPSEVRH